MLHISEGDLHAWLDGAITPDSLEGKALATHLEVCADCRQRLGAANKLIGEARDVLAAAQPGPRPIPTLDSLRNASETREYPKGQVVPERRSRSHRGGWRSLERLAWAASVVLALGAGWIGRDLLVERGWTDPFHSTAREDSRARKDSEMPRAPAVSEQAGDSVPEGLAAPKSRVPAIEGESAVSTKRGRPEDESAAAQSEEEAVGEVDQAGAARYLADRDAEPARERAAESKVLAEDSTRIGTQRMNQWASLEAPAIRRAAGPGDPDGCFAMKAMVRPPDRLSLVIEIRRSESDTDPQSGADDVLILSPDAHTREPVLGTWLPFAMDSVWMAFEIDGAVAILRVSPEDGGWAGNLRWHSAPAAGSGETAVRLVPVPCRTGEP